MISLSLITEGLVTTGHVKIKVGANKSPGISRLEPEGNVGVIGESQIVIPDFNERSKFSQLADWGRVHTVCALHTMSLARPSQDHHKLLFHASLLHVQTLGGASRM